jgi:hypothetical protein
MTDNIISGVVTILTAIVGIAILAVLVSRNAQTPQVLQSAGAAFSQSIGAAVSPVTGGGSSFSSPTLFTGGGAPGYPSFQ